MRGIRFTAKPVFTEILVGAHFGVWPMDVSRYGTVSLSKIATRENRFMTKPDFTEILVGAHFGVWPTDVNR